MDPRYFNRIVAVYGLGVDEFLDLFARQNHACAVCQRPLVLFSSAKSEKPVVDHCHSTGKVRGILCYGCNVALGWLEKDADRTACLTGYLRKQGELRAATRRNGDEVVAIRRAADAAQHERVQNLLDPTWVLMSELERALNTSQEGSRLPLGQSGALEKRADVELMLVPDEEVKEQAG